MNNLFLYDMTGRAVAILKDEGLFYSTSGLAVGFLNKEYVYSFSDRQLGTYEEGWVRDIGGSCVLFSNGADGFSPVRPVCQIDPVPGVFSVAPAKPVPAVPFAKAVKVCGWSALSPAKFFVQ